MKCPFCGFAESKVIDSRPRMKILFVKPLLLQSVFYAVWVIGFG